MNEKVRIYELSKELNLDNKDILEICNRLNIAVKSHSSTITESQAELIRMSAERYTPSTVAGRGNSSVSSGDGNAASSKTKRAGSQILAIHHKQNHPRSAPATKKKSGKSASPMLATPPRQPITPQQPLTAKSPQINRPIKPSPHSQETVNRPIIEETTHQQTKKTDKEPVTTTIINLETPQLLQPPVRPAGETPTLKTENRPIPKKAKKGDSPTPQENRKPRKRKSSPEKPNIEPVAKQGEVAPKPQLKKLAKPQKPKPHQESKQNSEKILLSSELEPELEDTEELETEILLTPPKRPQLKLKRPTPPRPSKGKIWEDEDEEQDEKAKSGKSSSKSKRRPQPLIDDDEEDFQIGQESGLLPLALSLSVARPPKPQSQNTQPAASVSSSKRMKKKAPKTGMGKNRADNREKRRPGKGLGERPDKVVLAGSCTVQELSELLKIPDTEIIKQLFVKGIAVNITQTLDWETACLVAEELGIEVETPKEKAAAAKETDMLDATDLENLQRRPPVVTIMGHVDHGKTTLLDSIRKTKVAEGEAGGITQHIGAYHVDLEHEEKKEQIVFLDTPGHEAFTAMRARGTRVTDIAILVVAADDGVRPQTREAISHARAAEVPIVIAINKIDKPGAEPDRVKQELTELDLVPEEWGGDTIMVPVSALKGENLDTLLEMILLVSEIEELSANPDRPAKGTVIEANLDRARGPVASLLVQNGTLRVGDMIVAGSVLGKIRAMINDRGEKVEAATPSFAVEILGLNEVPPAGDEFEVFENEKEARAIASERAEAQRQSRLQTKIRDRTLTLADISAQAEKGELKELNLILKADVQGSVEAILGSLKQLPQNEVKIRVLLAAPGEVTETDVDLAAASGAVVIGFNTTLASGSRQAADQEGVDIREYNIIYKLLDDIQGAMEGLLDPEQVEESLGQAEVRAVFNVGRGSVAGCYVQSGKVVRNRLIRVRRGGEVIYEGSIDSLKRVKEDVREVNSGYECGIGVAKFNDWIEGDIIEAYEMVMKRRTLSAK
ncbi:MAG: translation initiation factor IF-2 [Moorea sp. SIO2B7]|nr:translation initiation factor IF-2 [Moorena sp. SIO2B7]